MNDRLCMTVAASGHLGLTRWAMQLVISPALVGAVAAVDLQHWRRSGPTINRRSRRSLKRSLA